VNMRAILILVALFFVVGGCAVERPHAIINDITVRPEFETGYRLVAVDGKPVERAHGKGMSSISSFVPYAWVQPGTHSLTLQMDNDFKAKNSELPQEVTISAKLEAEKKYRIAMKDGTATLIPDFER
jgi:hypothetical protein